MAEQNLNPLVSVVMPAYNAERFIAKAIESVLNQTIQDFELIVVDDCSKDATASIAEEYAARDSRVKLLKNEQNLRVAGTRNRALEVCRGEYVALLDSDDIWYPDKLEKQIALAKKENADIVYCSYALIDEMGEKSRNDFIVPDKTDFEHLLQSNVIGCSTVMITGEIARNYRFSETWFHEDFVLWLRLLQEGKKAVGLTEVQVDYRVYSGSKASNKLKSAKYRWRIYREALEFSRWKSAGYFVRYAVSGFLKYRGKLR